MSTFRDTIASQPQIGLRFCLLVQGIPYIFLDGPIPRTKMNSAWSAPTSKGLSYVPKEHTLDVSGGIRIPGSQISRSSGDSQPSQLDIHLKETRDGFLHGLFAREKADGNYANLTASLAYDDSSGTQTATVDDTTGWAASGSLYLGRETLYYDSLTGTTFEDLTRDIFSIGYGDTIYRHEESIPNAPRVVTDFPRVWHGRYVRLIAYIVGADGTPYDTGFGGEYSAEIWRGVIAGNPRPMDDWQRWMLRCDSIESILDTEVGRDPIRGALLRIPQSSLQNSVGKVIQPNVADPKMSTWAFWLDGNTKYVSLRVKEWADQTAYDNQDPPTVYDYTGDDRIDLAPGSDATHKTRLGLELTWQTYVTAPLKTATGSCVLGVKHGNVWYAQMYGFGASKVFEVEILWDAPGSVGRLLGFGGTSVLFYSSAKGTATDNAEFEALAAYIPAAQTVPTIPFWYLDTDGMAGDAPAEPGYCKIGDGDEAEIVYYESITDVGASNPALQGIHLLKGVKRGQLGTVPREHQIKLNEDWTAASDQIEVTFGIGLTGSFVDAILQFSVSTGYGVHGTYDTLGDRVSVPLNPNHFDVDAIAAAGAQLTAEQVTIGLFTSKPFNLREMISDWLRPHGLYLTSRMNEGGDYLITIDRLLPPLESEALTSIGEAHLDLTDPAIYVDGLDRVLNEVVVHPRWNASEEDNTEDKVVVLDQDSISEFGKRKSVTWRLKGYQYGAGDAITVATKWAYRLFARYGRPYDLFRLHLNRAGLAIQAGDTITLTVPQAPNASGTRGITSRQAVVLQVEQVWHPAMGTGEATGADVTVVLEPYIRASTYAPSARVASYDSGDPSVTLHANSYTSAALGADVDHFEVGDFVYIYNEGDAGTRDLVEIVGITGNVVTLSTTLTITVSSTETVMVPADYDTAVASQKKHAYIADNAGSLGAAGDDPFHWI